MKNRAPLEGGWRMGFVMATNGQEVKTPEDGKNIEGTSGGSWERGGGSISRMLN